MVTYTGGPRTASNDGIEHRLDVHETSEVGPHGQSGLLTQADGACSITLNVFYQELQDGVSNC